MGWEDRPYYRDRSGDTGNPLMWLLTGSVHLFTFAGIRVRCHASLLLLIRNRRYATGQTLTELPAGTLERNEDPMNCAGRELLEETGYLAARLKPLSVFYTSPGILSERMYAFAAYDLERSGPPALEAGEEIEAAPASLDDAIEMIRTGPIIDAKTIATLLTYDRFHRNKQ